MNFDRYWERLVDRVHRGEEVLRGDEAMVWRLSAILGESYTGGIQGYFAERFAEFEEDMRALESVQLADLAAIYRSARRILYADAPLDESIVNAWLYREPDDPRTPIEEAAIATLTEQIGPRLDELEEVRDTIGVRSGLYEPG
jgi:hypothetical protein